MEDISQPKPRVSRLALISLLCVIISIIIDQGPWLHSGKLRILIGMYSALAFAILATILAIAAFRKISRNRERLKGRGWAVLGIVLGVILLYLIGPGIPRLIVSLRKADRGRAASYIASFSESLEYYKRNIGHYPLTTAGLKALEVRDPIDDPENKWKGPCVRFRKKNKAGNPLDPWGNEYRYTSDGKSFTITSYGADGKPGGTGFKADITSEQIKRGEKLW